MESLVQDIKFGVKLLWKEKGFAATAIATLALCIGANAAIFSVIHSVLLKPLPVPEADRILMLYNSYPNAGVERANNGAADYYDRQRALTVFEEQAMYNFPGLTIGEKGSVERVTGMAVTPSFFRLLRTQPLLGRIFTEAEGEPGNERQVILSFGLWQQLYGGDTSALGRQLRVYGNLHTVVGVMPEGFVYLNPDVRLWRPLAFTPEQREARHSNNWQMIGRLKPGATREQAQAQLNALNAANLERFPEFREVLINAGFHSRVVPLQEEVVRDIRNTLYLLWGAVLFVLLIGAVNILNLVMARSRARTRELATRLALGAGRRRVTRQLLTESILLTTLSGVIGLLLGYWGLKVLATLGLERIPRGTEIALDGTVVAFTLALAFAVGIALGLTPVLHALRVDASTVLHGEGRTGTRGRGARIWRRALVTAQVALAFILLTGAGLALASFRRVLAVNPGFTASNVLTASVALPRARYPDEAALRAFLTRALEKIRTLPAVSAAAATDTIPFGDNHSDSVILAEGYVMKPGESLISPDQVAVSPGFFETLQVPLIAGRFFDQRDTADSPPVLVIDDRLAAKFWPDTSAVGKRMWRPTNTRNLLQPDENTRWYTVIGVVGTVKFRGLVTQDDRVGTYYYPLSQSPRSMLTFALRTAAEPASLAPALRGDISSLDPELPLFDLRTMEERIDESLASRRSPMMISLGFGLVALFLAAVGIFGVLAFLVAQRTREIGIRMALGSSAEGIFALILREGMLVIGAGLALGLAGTLGLERFVGSVLYGVQPMEPVVLGPVAAALALVAVAACLLPARRAASVDPVVALRQE